MERNLLIPMRTFFVPILVLVAASCGTGSLSQVADLPDAGHEKTVTETSARSPEYTTERRGHDSVSESAPPRIEQKRDLIAIRNGSPAALRSSPHRNGRFLGKISPGREVEKTGEKNGWYKVCLREDGRQKEGWISKNSVRGYQAARHLRTRNVRAQCGANFSPL